jgi:hypothetical protein
MEIKKDIGKCNQDRKDTASFPVRGGKGNRMGWEWWIHRVSGYKSKARLTEKKLKRKNEQEITCLIFSLVAHPHIQQSYHK